jgi:hypothetical protein
LKKLFLFLFLFLSNLTFAAPYEDWHKIITKYFDSKFDEEFFNKTVTFKKLDKTYKFKELPQIERDIYMFEKAKNLFFVLDDILKSCNEKIQVLDQNILSAMTMEEKEELRKSKEEIIKVKEEFSLIRAKLKKDTLTFVEILAKRNNMSEEEGQKFIELIKNI